MKELTTAELCLLYLALGMAGGMCDNLEDRALGVKIIKLARKLERITQGADPTSATTQWDEDPHAAILRRQAERIKP